MLSVEEIQKRLQQRNLKAVASAVEDHGITYQTIYNLAKGLHAKPHKTTLRILNIYFEENP